MTMTPKGYLTTLPRRGVLPPARLAGGNLGAGAGLVLVLLVASASAVRINEVSDKGTPSACDGGDWIELFLPATADSPVDLSTGYVLHDDQGADATDALNFAALAAGTLDPLQPGDYLLLCRGTGAAAFSFGIGVDDTVTLRDATGGVASTTGALPGKGDDGITYAYDDVTEEYAYTSTPTPGEPNEITPPDAFETVAETKARLIAQEAEGTAFFNMDGDGKEVAGGLPAVVDFRVEMDPDVRADMHDVARSHATYRPWLSAQVTDADGGVLLDLASPGRIRPKGQFTLYMGTCMDESVPYQVDFGTGADGSDPAQTLFGVERAYLRKFLGDVSGSREWTAHRMLARFGLPHLRTRKVRLHINGERQGLYELIEAPDQEYVYQRSFPDFDPTSYGLYKVKLGTGGCGDYDPRLMEQAEARVDEPNTPPYYFDRGEHRPMVPVLKDLEACFGAFSVQVAQKHMDAALAYVRSGTDCGEFLVDAGLTDRKLGGKENDVTMAAFIDNHLAANTCDPGCTNSNLAKDVDVTSFLRNLAVLAGVVHSDSPLASNIQNFYLSYNGGLWSFVQWDHNDILSGAPQQLCGSACGGKTAANWSILRPTCRAFETNQVFGPLLSDPDLREQYVEYLREFVNDVMADEGFLGQIRAHLEAIEDDMAESVGGMAEMAAEFFPFELAVSGSDNGTWIPDAEGGFLADVGGGVHYTLLGMIRARATEIQEQLDAIDAGTFPRALDDIAPEETCVDWTREGPRPTCEFCPGGLAVAADTVVPDYEGATCGDLAGAVVAMAPDDPYCAPIQLAQPLCCPVAAAGAATATAAPAAAPVTTEATVAAPTTTEAPAAAPVTIEATPAAPVTTEAITAAPTTTNATEAAPTLDARGDNTTTPDNGAAAVGWVAASVPTVAVTLLVFFS